MPFWYWTTTTSTSNPYAVSMIDPGSTWSSSTYLSYIPYIGTGFVIAYPSRWETPTIPVSNPLPRPAFLKNARDAVRRSIELFRKFRPEEELKAFLRCQPVLIQGYRFTYRVKHREKILHHTLYPNSFHIPYDLHLLDRTGKPIAKGCVTIPHTPIIDQLLALILHVQDKDEEEELIRATNWSPILPVNLFDASGQIQ